MAAQALNTERCVTEAAMPLVATAVPDALERWTMIPQLGDSSIDGHSLRYMHSGCVDEPLSAGNVILDVLVLLRAGSVTLAATVVPA